MQGLSVSEYGTRGGPITYQQSSNTESEAEAELEAGARAMTTGGQLLVQCLEVQGVDRLFCVPGESYLPILDALIGSPIHTVVARHEGGAAMMAEADGKATGRPGVCLVTRGPGAANAMAGVHVARQDSTPMVLIVGQVARGVRGRDAFQEVDFGKTFADVAKLVIEIDDADRIPEVMNRAWHVAMNGRPGPVVLVVPEDMLTDETGALPGPRVVAVEPGPDGGAMEELQRLLQASARPVVILGGSRWDAVSVSRVQQWASTASLPVAVSFRRQRLFAADHPCFAGDLGLGANPELIALIKASDLVILLGTRLSEIASQDYTLLDATVQKIVHVHPGAEELGRVFSGVLLINASPIAFISSLVPVANSAPDPRVSRAHDSYLAWGSWSAACRRACRRTRSSPTVPVTTPRGYIGSTAFAAFRPSLRRPPVPWDTVCQRPLRRS
jgi:acetolactate synthase I/II/III large subunit